MRKVGICLLNEIIIYTDVTCQLFAVLTRVLWFYIYNIESTLHPDGFSAFPCFYSEKPRPVSLFYLLIPVLLLIGQLFGGISNEYWPKKIVMLEYRLILACYFFIMYFLRLIEWLNSWKNWISKLNNICLKKILKLFHPMYLIRRERG